MWNFRLFLLLERLPSSLHCITRCASMFTTCIKTKIYTCAYYDHLWQGRLLLKVIVDSTHQSPSLISYPQASRAERCPRAEEEWTRFSSTGMLNTEHRRNRSTPTRGLSHFAHFPSRCCCCCCFSSSSSIDRSIEQKGEEKMIIVRVTTTTLMMMMRIFKAETTKPIFESILFA